MPLLSLAFSPLPCPLSPLQYPVRPLPSLRGPLLPSGLFRPSPGLCARLSDLLYRSFGLMAFAAVCCGLLCSAALHPFPALCDLCGLLSMPLYPSGLSAAPVASTALLVLVIKKEESPKVGLLLLSTWLLPLWVYDIAACSSPPWASSIQCGFSGPC